MFHICDNSTRITFYRPNIFFNNKKHNLSQKSFNIPGNQKKFHRIDKLMLNEMTYQKSMTFIFEIL